jgi:hypothetical protein
MRRNSRQWAQVKHRMGVGILVVEEDTSVVDDERHE